MPCSLVRLCGMRFIHVIGIGVGDPDFVTTQAIRALNDQNDAGRLQRRRTPDEVHTRQNERDHPER